MTYGEWAILTVCFFIMAKQYRMCNQGLYDTAYMVLALISMGMVFFTGYHSV